MYTDLVIQHPFLAFFLYILICAVVGIGFFVTYSIIRKKLEIRKNMKARAQRDKLN